MHIQSRSNRHRIQWMLKSPTINAKHHVCKPFRTERSLLVVASIQPLANPII